MEQRAAVRRATWAVLALVAADALGSLLAVVLRDELVAAWSGGPAADDSIQPPAFVPVVVVLYVTLASLILVLLALLRSGQSWARHCLAGLVIFLAVGTLAALRTGPPALFVAVAVVSLVLDAVTVCLLWHPAMGTPAREGEPFSSAGT